MCEKLSNLIHTFYPLNFVIRVAFSQNHATY